MNITKEFLDVLADDREISRTTYEEMLCILEDYKGGRTHAIGDANYLREYLNSIELVTGSQVSELYEDYITNCEISNNSPCTTTLFGRLLHSEHNFVSKVIRRNGKTVRVLYTQLIE